LQELALFVAEDVGHGSMLKVRPIGGNPSANEKGPITLRAPVRNRCIIPDQPHISSTRWRVVADQTGLRYYYNSVTSMSTFWVDLNKADLKKGAPILQLPMGNSQVYSGDVTADFKPAPHQFEFATVPQEKSDQ
jgi:hypothetical protein